MRPAGTGPEARLDPRMAALETAAARATLSSAFCDVPRCALVLHRDRLEVRLDRSGPGTDARLPLRRAVQGAGAVVLGARVALAAQDWAVEVDRLPHPEDRDLLAVLRPVERSPEAGLAPLAALAAGGPLHRRTARTRPPSPALLARLARAAALEDTLLVPVVSDTGRRLVEQLAHDARAVRGEDADGPGGALAPSATGPGGFLLLATQTDDERAWLRSGEAMERVLLGLAHGGRAGSVLAQVLDVPLTRDRVRSALCWDEHPQALIRVE